MSELLKKFELNNKVLNDFDSLMSQHLDQIEELCISEIDAKSKLLNIVGLCINIKTLIIEGDQRTNVNAIIANVCKPELLQNLILNNVKIPSSFSFKKLINLKMISLNNIRGANIKVALDEIVNPENIEALNFEQVDFAKNSIEILAKFNNLKYLNLIKVQNCKLDKLETLSDMLKIERINIEKNTLNFEEINTLIEYKFNKQISVDIVSKNENVITNSLEISEIGKISITINNTDLEKLANCVNFENISELLIIMTDKNNLQNYINILKKVRDKISIAIKDVSCLEADLAEQLRDELNLEYVNIIDFDETLQYEKNRYCYKIGTYIKIRKAIDEIVSNIEEDEELCKFLAIYKLLGENIMYDDMLEESVKDYSKINFSKSSNLENGLLEKKCVASGFAEILKNCLAVLEIETKIIRGNFAGIGEEHIWNQVKINDIWYNVDLGLDSKKMSNASNIKNKPIYCLISDKVFSKTHIPKIANTEYCPETFNQKIVVAFFKKVSIIKIYIQNIMTKIKKTFSYNKLGLPEGKTVEIETSIEEEKNEN